MVTIVKQNTKFYTGIGSRETPANVLLVMQRIASQLENLGFVLRSGGATGADQAFESGVIDNRHKQIFYATHATKKAIDLASTIHPAWQYCTEYARKLHGRNCMQVLGTNLDTPSKFVICWTRDAKLVGGTATAIALAKRQGIKVFNLANIQTYNWFVEWLRN